MNDKEISKSDLLVIAPWVCCSFPVSLHLAQRWCESTERDAFRVTSALPQEVVEKAAAASSGSGQSRAAASSCDTPASSSSVASDVPGKGSGMELRVRRRGVGEKSGGSTFDERKQHVTRGDTGTTAPTGSGAVRRNPSRVVRKEQGVATADMEGPSASSVRSGKRGRHADGEGGGECRRTKRRQGSREGRAAVATSATPTSAEDLRARDSGVRHMPEHLARVTGSMARMRQAQGSGRGGAMAATAACPMMPKDPGAARPAQEAVRGWILNVVKAHV